MWVDVRAAYEYIKRLSKKLKNSSCLLFIKRKNDFLWPVFDDETFRVPSDSSSSAVKLLNKRRLRWVLLSGFCRRIDLRLTASFRSLLQCIMGACQAAQLPTFQPPSAHNAALMSCLTCTIWWLPVRVKVTAGCGTTDKRRDNGDNKTSVSVTDEAAANERSVVFKSSKIHTHQQLRPFVFSGEIS